VTEALAFIAAIGGLLAALASGYAAAIARESWQAEKRERERRQQTDREAQARLVLIRPRGSGVGRATDSCFEGGVDVVNRSRETVYDVTASGWFALVGEEEREMLSGRSNLILPDGTWSPRCQVPNLPLDPVGRGVPPHTWRVTVTFRDAAGVCWSRSAQDEPWRLEEIDEAHLTETA
jgi:hypothetical protein